MRERMLIGHCLAVVIALTGWRVIRFRASAARQSRTAEVAKACATGC
jgi:hypothetical protein